MGAQKYIFVDGVMKMNPAYAQEQASQGNAPTQNPNALAVVSSMDDAMTAGQQQAQATGAPMKMAESTMASIQIMQDDDYLKKFQAPGQFKSGEILDRLTQYFARYEVPLGMVNKLCMLSEYSLNLIVDDSGSMNAPTDSTTQQAGDYMKKKLVGMPGQPQAGGMQGGQSRMMTRWEEAADRVHTILDLLTFVPTGPVAISFLNRPDRLTLDRRGKSPEQFAADSHAQIDRVFAAMPQGQTPTKRALQNALMQCPPMTMHYLFTDGEPTDAMGQRVEEDGEDYTRYPEIDQMIINRMNPRATPITFVSCTDNDSEVNWMKVLEEKAPFSAEIDDYADEYREVVHDQGPHFPYTKGFWLISLLVAAINPDDLDAMDESAPFTKMTLDNCLGRVLTDQDYQHYFRAHPQEAVCRNHYQEFATARATGKQIWQRHGLRAIARPPAPVGLSPYNQQQPGQGQQPMGMGGYGAPGAGAMGSGYGAPAGGAGASYGAPAGGAGASYGAPAGGAGASYGAPAGGAGASYGAPAGGAGAPYGDPSAGGYPAAGMGQQRPPAGGAYGVPPSANPSYGGAGAPSGAYGAPPAMNQYGGGAPMGGAPGGYPAPSAPPGYPAPGGYGR